MSIGDQTAFNGLAQHRDRKKCVTPESGRYCCQVLGLDERNYFSSVSCALNNQRNFIIY